MLQAPLISRDPFLAGFAALRKQFRRNLAHPALSGEAALAPGTMARLDRHMKPANRTRTSGLPRLGKGASGKYLFKGHGGDRLAMPRLDPNATKRDVTGQHYRPGLTTANQIDSHATTLADIEPFNEHDRCDCHHRRCFARLFARYHRARNLLDVSISHGSPNTTIKLASKCPERS